MESTGSHDGPLQVLTAQLDALLMERDQVREQYRELEEKAAIVKRENAQLRVYATANATATDVLHTALRLCAEALERMSIPFHAEFCGTHCFGECKDAALALALPAVRAVLGDKA